MQYKEIIVSNLESQFEFRVQQSTWIEAFKQRLKELPALGSFQTWGEDFINEVTQQLNSLNALRLQIQDFKDNQISLTRGLSEIKAGFTQYDEQEAQSKSKLLTLFTQNAFAYFVEKNNFYNQLSDKKISLLIAGLNFNDLTEFENQLNTCIQLINTHIKNPERLLNFFEIIKKSSLNLNEPDLSHFIFTAQELATQSLKKSIERNFAELNIQQVKQDCEDQHLFCDLYQNTLLFLAKHYQAYSAKLNLIKNKLEFLDNHLGEAIIDWWDDYKTLSDSTFLSTANHQVLIKKYQQLGLLETQLSLNDDKEFLKKIKSKVQAFLNNEIERLKQAFLDYQTRIDQFASYSPAAAAISTKLQQMLKSRYDATHEIWIKCQERLASIKAIEELKNFQHHFPKEISLDADSLNFDELRAALILLEESNPDIRNIRFIQGFSNIPLENLSKKIFFILENLNSPLLPDSINHLLQFIHSKNSPLTLNNAKTYLATTLQAFFTHHPERLTLCLAYNAPLNTLINTETYERLINILHYTDAIKLEKWSKLNPSLKSKIKELSASDEITPIIIDEALDQLISTKKILLLFEDKNTPTTPGSENNTVNHSLWDACCLFKEFANKSCLSELPYLKKLEEDSKTKDFILNFQKAVMNLDWFIKEVQRLEIQSYAPTLFLKSGKTKQQYVHQLINNLKNIPITQADTASINNIFEQWKKDYQLLIDEPRYRLLIKLCMLIYRQLMKLFFPASDCFTTSHQTVDKLQEQFLQASQHLQRLKNQFTQSVQEVTHSVPNKTVTQLTSTVS